LDERFSLDVDPEEGLSRILAGAGMDEGESVSDEPEDEEPEET